MIPIPEAFSARYAQARVKFLEAAATASLPIESHRHPLLGRDGEDLAMDVVRDGPPDADKLLIVSSGCHGVEGFCGSGVQVFALHDQEWRDLAHAQGVTVLGLASLDERGHAWYDHDVTERLAEVGMRIAAMTPDRFAAWLAEVTV